MFSVLAFFAGAIVAVQSRIAGQLTNYVHNGITAGNCSNYVGLALATILVFGSKREREGLRTLKAAIKDKHLRLWELIGGWGGGLFVATQSTQGPVLGVALFTITFIAGQTLFALMIDELGISTNGRKTITWARATSAFVTLVGVGVAVYPDFSSANFQPFSVILVVIIGGATAFQHALNSRVNAVVPRPLVTAWVNFCAGSTMVTTIFFIRIWTGHPMGHLPTHWSDLWMYLGGPLGLSFVATTAFILKHLGMLKWGLLGITGQLACALIIDWIFPTNSSKLSLWLILGSLITLVSVLGARYFEGQSSPPSPSPLPR